MIRQVIIMIVNMNIPRICIHSDSQIIVNVVNGQISVSKNIINIVDDIRQFL